MKFFRPLEAVLAVCVALLLIYDYFPESPLAHAVSLKLLIGAMLVIFIASVYRNRKQGTSQKTAFWTQVFFLVYIVGLMAVLTALGGTSQVGLAFDKGIFWAALAIAVMEIGFQRRRLKQQGEGR